MATSKPKALSRKRAASPTSGLRDSDGRQSASKARNHVELPVAEEALEARVAASNSKVRIPANGLNGAAAVSLALETDKAVQLGASQALMELWLAED